MTPWSYDEMKRCKAILYPEEEKFPTTLMNQLFDWYGGVPRDVFQLTSSEFNTNPDVDTVVQKMSKKLIDVIQYEGPVSNLIHAHQARTREEEYSHRVLHLCTHHTGDLAQYSVAWASPRVGREVFRLYAEEIRRNLKSFRGINGFTDGNARGAQFEVYAHELLREGGTFQVRRLCEDLSSDQNAEVTFPATELRDFRTYEDVDLGTDVYWQLQSKNLASIDSLRGPANFFQMTVSSTHPIKHHGLAKALDLVDKSESPIKLYFVVPSNVYWTFRCQPHHNQKGALFKKSLGERVCEVEQWALLIPTGSEEPARGKDKEYHAGTKRKFV
ncbi:hypothetical protein PtA15_12A296 [Puccinia triticina]|uniref:Uncharacterized protein n=1 Tax=Puccinia triticina TaxID=208348 RepID=A0ABY7D0T8_9BASI|nr:uncharacterized protein PtA15_12A296 [Puccinia triticina]WAQ90307.1 hypothetical protein PtA15_12A296 [Puccinia triticina]